MVFQHAFIAMQQHILFLTSSTDSAIPIDTGHYDYMLQYVLMQVWRVPHPPQRGRYWLGQQPQVHAGFLKSWLVGDLKDKVIARVLLHLQQQKDQAVRRVIVTGRRPFEIRQCYRAQNCLVYTESPPECTPSFMTECNSQCRYGMTAIQH